MSIKVKQMLCPQSKKSIKFPFAMTPTRIVVHNTANDASAVNEITYMNNNNEQKSFHFAIDDKEVVQGLPLNVNGWHAGDKINGKGNREGIGIEICYSKSGGARFIAAEKLAAKFIAQLLKERNWGIDKVTKHQDYSGKYCPHRTLDMGWDRFLNMIKAEMNPKTATTTTSTSTAAKINKNDIVKLANNATYYNGKSIPSWVKKVNWYVSEVAGNRAIIDKSTDGKYSICSPVDVKYLTVVKASAPSNTTQTTTNKNTTTNTSSNNAVTKGKKIVLSKAPLFASSTSTKQAKTVTGTYYIWSADVVNGRVRITNNASYVGKSGQVTGWIAISSFGGSVSSTTNKTTTSSNTTTTTKPASTLYAGKKIVLNKCPIYSSAGAWFKSGTITGTYYLWDASVTKNRIRITNSTSRVGKAGQVTGWISVANAK